MRLIRSPQSLFYRNSRTIRIWLTAPIIVLGGTIAALITNSGSAEASIQVDGDAKLQTTVARCLDSYPAGDFSHLLRNSYRRKITVTEIVGVTSRTDPVSSDDGSNGVGTDSNISLNIADRIALSDNVVTDPCASLYHELSHAYDFALGQDDDSWCGQTEIPTDEVKATLAENAYRRQAGLKQRTTYNHKTLPGSTDVCGPRSKGKSKRPSRGCDYEYSVTQPPQSTAGTPLPQNTAGTPSVTVSPGTYRGPGSLTKAPSFMRTLEVTLAKANPDGTSPGHWLDHTVSHGEDGTVFEDVYEGDKVAIVGSDLQLLDGHIVVADGHTVVGTPLALPWNEGWKIMSVTCDGTIVATAPAGPGGDWTWTGKKTS